MELPKKQGKIKLHKEEGHVFDKSSRFFTDALHMGYPLANSAVYPWLESVLA
jgi:hypothetical protein